jgi:hypothetical protein
MPDEWSSNVSDWQGVDDEPTTGSKNLVESGGVAKFLADKTTEYSPTANDYTLGVVRPNGSIEENTGYHYLTMQLKKGATILLNSGDNIYCGRNIAILYKAKSDGAFDSIILAGNGETKKVSYTNDTISDVYIGFCIQSNVYKYSIVELAKSSSVEQLENLKAEEDSKISTNILSISENGLNISKILGSITDYSVEVQVGQSGLIMKSWPLHIPAGQKIILRNGYLRDFIVGVSIDFMDSRESVIYHSVELNVFGLDTVIDSTSNDVEKIRIKYTPGAIISSGTINLKVIWGELPIIKEDINNIIDDKIKIPVNYTYNNLGILNAGLIKYDYNIIVAYGQSLSVGTGIVTEALDAPDNALMLDSLTTPTQTVQTAQLTKIVITPDSSTQQACPPSAIATCNIARMYNRLVGGDKKFVHLSFGVGGFTLAKLMDRYRYLEVNTGRWYFEGLGNMWPYMYLIKAINRIKDIADAENKTCGVIIVNFNHGEEDYGDSSQNPSTVAGGDWNCNGDADEYKERLLQLKADLEEDLLTNIGQSTHPAWFVSQCSGAFVKDIFTINQAQIDLVDNKTIFAGPSTYPVPNRTDGQPTGNGYRWYGEYLAKANCDMLFRNLEPNIFALKDYTIKDNKVILDFIVPVLPIRIDTHIVPEIRNYGFFVRVQDIDATITDISIEENRIVLTTDRVLTGNVTIQYATYKAAAISVNGKAEGNICDSAQYNAYYKCMQDVVVEGQTIEYVPQDESGNPIIGKQYPMYNFLQPFKINILVN